MKKYLFVVLCLVFIQPLYADDTDGINTFDIAKDVTAAALNNPTGNFLNWKLTGICIWLHWSIYGPYLTPTWKVNEFMPDTIVSVYNTNGEDPFFIAKKLFDPILKSSGDAIAKSIIGVAPVAGTDGVSSHNDGMMQFKEVDVIGDPMASVLSNSLGSMLISSVASPYVPYYSSLLDSVQWRDPKLDLLTHPQDIFHQIGTLSDWGSLYPLNGYVNQSGDYKAAAVDAVRAMDIVGIAGSTAHLHTSLVTGSCGDHCTIEPSDESHAYDSSQIKFQEIYPVESNTAEENIGVNDPAIGTYGQDQYTRGNGNYVWIVWRHYYGCIQGGGKLWQVIGF